MTQSYLKIMDDDGYADTHPSKGFRIITLGIGDIVEYSPNDPLNYGLRIVRAGQAVDDNPMLFYPDGNVYLMNSEGRTVASYGVSPYRPKMGSGDDSITIDEAAALEKMSPSKRADYMHTRSVQASKPKAMGKPLTVAPAGRVGIIVDTNPPSHYDGNFPSQAAEMKAEGRLGEQTYKSPGVVGTLLSGRGLSLPAHDVSTAEGLKAHNAEVQAAIAAKLQEGQGRVFGEVLSSKAAKQSQAKEDAATKAIQDSAGYAEDGGRPLQDPETMAKMAAGELSYDPNKILPSEVGAEHYRALDA